jgi:hypothetical protein
MLKSKSKSVEKKEAQQMKNKSVLIIVSVIFLCAVAFFIITVTGDDAPQKILFQKNEKTHEKTFSDSFFNEPDNNPEPETADVSGTAATKYEPVYPVSISSEDVKQSVTLHHLVPEDCRKTYFELLDGLNNYENEITLSSPVNEDLFLRSLIYVRDFNPELFFIDWSLYNYKVTVDNKVAAVSFKFFYEDVSPKAEEFEEKVNEIVSQANRYPNLFERELFVHDYLVNNTVYQIDERETGTAYGALINRKARCEGYARAFQILMLRIGVPTFSVIGTAENERHMWNAVDLYGECYFVDVTFDDDSSETNITYLKESEIGHSCFNMPKEIIERTHIISDSGSKDKYGAYQNLVLPECNSYNFNYYRIRGYMAENSEQFKYLLEKGSSNKRACVFFKGDMPSSQSLQDDFKSFFESYYGSGGYSIYYTPSNSPVFMRNVYEISWTTD